MPGCPVKPKLLTKRAKINFDCQQPWLAISCNSNSSEKLPDRTVNVPDYECCQARGNDSKLSEESFYLLS